MKCKACLNGGAVIFPEANGYLPGLSGRLNPKRDNHDRAYLCASNMAINGGKPQPVHFIPGEDLRLTDADGRELMARIIEIVGRSALVEYRPYSQRRWKMTIKELVALLGKVSGRFAGRCQWV